MDGPNVCTTKSRAPPMAISSSIWARPGTICGLANANDENQRGEEREDGILPLLYRLRPRRFVRGAGDDARERGQLGHAGVRFGSRLLDGGFFSGGRRRRLGRRRSEEHEHRGEEE